MRIIADAVSYLVIIRSAHFEILFLEESDTSYSAVIGVSSVSLLVIVTLITVNLTQCLLILRMRKSKDVLHSNETYAEPSIHHVDVTTAPNEAYALHKIVEAREEDTYEIVK